MTDVSLPVKAINAHDYPHAALQQRAAHAAHAHHYNPTPTIKTNGSVDDAEEDETISCVCGYADDDGWTVQCDKCNRWQHQLCYYPDYEEKTLPAHIDHFCISCEPRRIDIDYARRRQSQKRDAQSTTSLNGAAAARRSVPKTAKKKKVLDANGTAAYANGWPLDKARHDRNSASPRDHQPPPSKRPKTTHRTSDSTTNSTKGHSRKRNASTANPPARRSLSRSPDVSGPPVAPYSEEFLQKYIEDDWELTDTNTYGLVAMGAIGKWLAAPDDDFEKETRARKTEVYARWDGDINDIPGKAETEIVEIPDAQLVYDNAPVLWKAVCAINAVAEGAYIGEVKGHIGTKEEYQSDPANRWRHLRHPEPFVFFHPQLALVVDARSTGTELRYIRRSCQPNARLGILVTGGTDHHFCFMATQQIEPGMEITIPWDTQHSDLTYRDTFDEESKTQLSRWVTNVLVNCGPCACQSPEGQCLMERYDRRHVGKDLLPLSPSDGQHPPPLKVVKGNKKRKIDRQQISPSNTHSHNSRAGSEVRPDDTGIAADSPPSRSTSGTAPSRDITPHPNGHLSTTMPELSERERKKLAKEEEMFRKQEVEQAAGRSAGSGAVSKIKKKRSSNGSSANAASLSSARERSESAFAPPLPSPRYVDASTSRHSSASMPSPEFTTSNNANARPAAKKRSSHAVRPSIGGKTTATSVLKRAHAASISAPSSAAKPTYSSTGVQCDMDEHEAEVERAKALAFRPKRVFVPLRQRLLERCARNNAICAERSRRAAADHDPARQASKTSPRLEGSTEEDVDADADADAELETSVTSSVSAAVGKVQDPQPMDVDAPGEDEDEDDDVYSPEEFGHSSDPMASQPILNESGAAKPIQQTSPVPDEKPAIQDQVDPESKVTQSSASAVVRPNSAQKASPQIPQSGAASTKPYPALHIDMPPPSTTLSNTASTAENGTASTAASATATSAVDQLAVSNTSTSIYSPAEVTTQSGIPEIKQQSPAPPGSSSPAHAPGSSGNAAAAGVTPGTQSLRKKMSLSEYASKRKNRGPSTPAVPTMSGLGISTTSASSLAPATDREGSPASTASGYTVGPATSKERNISGSSGSYFPGAPAADADDENTSVAGTTAEEDVDDREREREADAEIDATSVAAPTAAATATDAPPAIKEQDGDVKMSDAAAPPAPAVLPLPSSDEKPPAPPVNSTAAAAESDTPVGAGTVKEEPRVAEVEQDLLPAPPQQQQSVV